MAEQEQKVGGIRVFVFKMTLRRAILKQIQHGLPMTRWSSIDWHAESRLNLNRSHNLRASLVFVLP